MKSNKPPKSSVPDSSTQRSMVRQPNKITMARMHTADLQSSTTNALRTLTQYENRVIIRIIEALQPEVDLLEKLERKERESSQLSIFNSDVEFVTVRIPFAKLAPSPDHYRDVKDALKSLRQISISYDDKIKETEVTTGLIVKFQTPKKDKYAKEIDITLDKVVAKELINIAGGYTRYDAEVAWKVRSVYTSRIYQLLSRWKDLGKCIIPIEEFRSWLGLESKYKEYRDLKRRILTPTEEELKNPESGSDIYFDLTEKKNATTITHLVFTIYRRVELQLEENLLQKKKDSIVNMLKHHFGCTPAHLLQLEPLFVHAANIPLLMDKIIEINSYINKKRDSIHSVADYAITALLNTPSLHT